MFESLSDRLGATLDGLRSQGRLSEEDIQKAMREIRLALLEADVNFEVVKEFVAQVRERALGQEVLKSLTSGQQVVKAVHEELTTLMGAGSSKLAFTGRPPTAISITSCTSRTLMPYRASSARFSFTLNCDWSSSCSMPVSAAPGI